MDSNISLDFLLATLSVICAIANTSYCTLINEPGKTEPVVHQLKETNKQTKLFGSRSLVLLAYGISSLGLC